MFHFISERSLIQLFTCILSSINKRIYDDDSTYLYQAQQFQTKDNKRPACKLAIDDEPSKLLTEPA